MLFWGICIYRDLFIGSTVRMEVVLFCRIAAIDRSWFRYNDPRSFPHGKFLLASRSGILTRTGPQRIRFRRGVSLGTHNLPLGRFLRRSSNDRFIPPCGHLTRPCQGSKWKERWQSTICNYSIRRAGPPARHTRRSHLRNSSFLHWNLRGAQCSYVEIMCTGAVGDIDAALVVMPIER
jgi:hypothetical protein